MFAVPLRRPRGITVLRFLILIDLVLLALLTLAGCKANTPTPPAPKVRTVAVIAQSQSSQPIANASVSITGTGFSKSGTTNVDGYVAFNGILDCPVAFTVSVTAPQFAPYNGLYGQSCGNVNVPVALISTVPPPPPAPFVEPEVALHPGSIMFLRPDGTPQALRGVTAFLFHAHMRRGEDVGPALDALYQGGFNEIRVFGRVNSDPGAGWDEWTDYKHPETDPNFASSLGAFFDLAALHHVRVQYVPLTYPDSVAVQHAQLQTAYDVAAGRWNVSIEDANEPDAQGINVAAAHAGINTHGVLWEYGTSDPQLTDPVNCIGTNLVGPSSEDHSQRDQATWPMKAKNAKDLHDGWGKNDSQPCGPNNFTFAGTHVPQGENEPPGADEVQVNGRRYTSVTDFQAYFAVCAFYAARCTFHTQDLIKGITLVGPVQRSIAAGLLQVWQLIGPSFSSAPMTCQYTRGRLADLPIAWGGDSDSLHTYATICGATAFVADIRATRPTVGVHGWTVQDHVGPVYRLVR